MKGFESLKISGNSRDLILFTLILLLGFGGILILYPASSVIAQIGEGDPEYYFKKQILWFVIGILSLLFFSFFPLEILRKLAVPGMLIVMILLALVYVPGIGKSVSSNRESFNRWISLGPITFQPSEFAKIALILYASTVFAKKDRFPEDFSLQKYLPSLIFASVPLVAIVAEPQYGTTVCMIVVLVTMLYLSGFPAIRLFVLLLGSFPPMFLVAILYKYRLERFRVWLDPYEYRYEGGYQLVTSYRAFREGGMFGEEFASGFAHRYLTYGHTDFILALFAENHGLFGIVILIALFLLVMWRAIYVVRKIQDPFIFMLASGSVIMIITQTLLNMLVVVGLVPTTGVSLPFVSYGGSSLIVTLSFCGIILNATSYNREPGIKPDVSKEAEGVA